jgi:hypothetical protein
MSQEEEILSNHDIKQEENHIEEENLIDNLINKYAEEAYEDINEPPENKLKDSKLENYFGSSAKKSIEEEDFLSNSKNVLKKLKKKAIIEQEKHLKKVNRKLNFRNFIEAEAELGSDDENHDDNQKKIQYDEEDEMDEKEALNEDLKDLIEDEGHDIYEGVEDIQNKYFKDMLDQDRKEIKKVISGPDEKLLQRRRRLDQEGDEDYIGLNARKKIKTSEEEEEEEGFGSKNIFRNIEDLEKRIKEGGEGEEDNEELKEMLQNYHSNVIKKLSEQQDDSYITIKNRMKENEKILENVINLNSSSSSFEISNLSKRNSGLSTNENSLQASILFKKSDGFNFSQPNANTNQPSNNTANCFHMNALKFKSSMSSLMSNNSKNMLFNSRNSLLHAMKTDKYYINNEQMEETHSLNPLNKNGKSKTDKNYSIFNRNQPKTSVTSFSSNLTALFSKSTKHRHDQAPTIKGNQIIDANNSLSSGKKPSLKKFF